MKHFTPKNRCFYYYSGVLLSIIFLFFSCYSSKYASTYSACKDPDEMGTPAAPGTETGNYFYPMKISYEEYKKLSGTSKFKRFIFQFKNVSSKNGRNEFEIDSYAWRYGLIFVHDYFIKDGFLEKETDAPLLKIEPSGNFAFANIELRDSAIREDDFKGVSSILLVPYYDKCKKCLMIKMIENPYSKDGGSAENNKFKGKSDEKLWVDLQPNFDAAALKEDKRVKAILGEASRVVLNPCPPYRPQGK